MAWKRVYAPTREQQSEMKNLVREAARQRYVVGHNGIPDSKAAQLVEAIAMSEEALYTLNYLVNQVEEYDEPV